MFVLLATLLSEIDGVQANDFRAGVVLSSEALDLSHRLRVRHPHRRGATGMAHRCSLALLAGGRPQACAVLETATDIVFFFVSHSPSAAPDAVVHAWLAPRPATVLQLALRVAKLPVRRSLVSSPGVVVPAVVVLPTHDHAIVVAKALALKEGQGRLVEGQALIRHDKLCESLSHLLRPDQSEVELAFVHQCLELFERQVLRTSSRANGRLEQQRLVDVEGELLDHQVIGRV